ncbi:MAG TPA: hypothetical protein VLT35_07455, partial [Methanocella sp.]|nr:hypothetical protein [Methanocella sp.]
MVSIFNRWGKFITSHPWAIIALWIVILVVSLPLAGSLGNDLQYSENSFVPKSLESVKAMEQYDALFVRNSSATTEDLMIAIDSGNHTMNHLFIDSVNNSLNHDPAVKNVSRVSSAYSAQVDALVGMAPGLHRALTDLYDQAYDGNAQLYGAYDSVREANDGMYQLRAKAASLSDQLLNGIEQARSGNEMLYDARDQAVAASAGLYQIKNANPNMTDDQVISAFMAAQNMTSPEDRAKLATIYGLGPDPAPAAIDQLVLSAASQEPGSDPKTIAALYGLGRNPSSTALGEYVVGQVTAGLDAAEAQFVRDVYGLGHVTNEQLDTFALSQAYAGKNETERQSIRDVWDLGEHPSDETISDYVLAQAARGANGTAQAMLGEVYGLGRRPGFDTIDRYVAGKVAGEMNLT